MFAERASEHIHVAASLMKLPLVVAAYRLADRGLLDLDAPVPVHNVHASALGGGPYACTQGYDQDDATWDRQGSAAPLRWLCRQAIVRSGNLATNLVLEHVRRAGWGEVARALSECDAAHGTVVSRGIQDEAAAAAGLANLVTAGDMGRLMRAIARGAAASPASCAELVEVLDAQEWRDGIAAGVPAGTRVASKSGWVEGVAHDVAFVRPVSGPSYVLAVCLSAPVSEEEGFARIAEVSRLVWEGWAT